VEEKGDEDEENGNLEEEEENAAEENLEEKACMYAALCFEISNNTFRPE